jgi:SAM-dependent methyltransferase
LFRFTNTQEIKAIYGVEPGESMHSALRERATQAGLGDKYKILNGEAKLESLVPLLVKEGLLESNAGSRGSSAPPFDEIVCIRVLCGVPEQDAVIDGLYGLLKPGGRMVICEHVANTGDASTGGTGLGRMFQQLYMWMGWRFWLSGCELMRDTLASLKRAAEKDGGWDKIDVQAFDPWSALPHIAGVLVKKK